MFICYAVVLSNRYHKHCPSSKCCEKCSIVVTFLTWCNHQVQLIIVNSFLICYLAILASENYKHQSSFLHCCVNYSVFFNTIQSPSTVVWWEFCGYKQQRATLLPLTLFSNSRSLPTTMFSCFKSDWTQSAWTHGLQSLYECNMVARVASNLLNLDELRVVVTTMVPLSIWQLK